MLVAHGLLLGRLAQLQADGAGPRPRQPGIARVHVRHIPPAARAAAPPRDPVEAQPATARAAAPAPRPVPIDADRPRIPARPGQAAPPVQASASPPENGRDDAAATQSNGMRVPVYATQLPPPVTLHYALQRGRSSGQAELHWATDGARYELAWRGALAGVALPAATSVGRLDAHGIAPERQSESRRGRELRAVNFQRDSGRITFSGPQREYALPPGAQDRLSWMLQIAGVLAADPSLAQVGARVQLFVAGPRGDAAPWVFEVTGHETVDLPAGPVADAVHLRREPERPYDTRVDLWLDPARHHLPVRARLLPLPAGEGSEFVLEGLTAP